MREEAIEKLKQMVTPDVTLDRVSEADDRILARVVYHYRFPQYKGGEPITWQKLFSVEADEDGVVFLTRDML